MKLSKAFRNFTILVIVVCNIGCDQVSKIIVRQEIGSNESFHFFSNHFTLTKVENTGAFLSIGSTLPYFIKLILLFILPAAALLWGIYFLLIKQNIPKAIVVGACFIIGGGLGNLYDRVLYGSVTDFLHLDFEIFETGIFNLADVSVMIGLFIIILGSQRKNIGFHKMFS